MGRKKPAAPSPSEVIIREALLKEPEGGLKGLPFMDPALGLERRVDDLLGRLTFEEKCILSAGWKNNSPAPVLRLGIPYFRMADGPHGIAPYATRGLGGSVLYGDDGLPVIDEGGEKAKDGSSTYFPTGIQMASTWDPAVIEEFGKAIGEEMRAIKWHMLLGPAINMCRTPMNGRTFEYHSEDPLLSGKIAAAAIRGIQGQRIATCVKHYAVNNQEWNRFKVSAVVSRRVMEEIYFPAFKIAVQEGDAWGLMTSYNEINGTYVSEDPDVLRRTLLDDWGFKGVVVSDWGATRYCKGIKTLVEAGLGVEMGSRDRYKIEQMQAMKAAGDFPEQAFDGNVRRFLRAMFLVGLFDDPTSLPKGSINTDEHVLVARKVAEEGMVLLKNDGLLPIDAGTVKRVAVVGKHAVNTFGKRGGSSAVGAHHEVTVRQGIEKKMAGKAEVIEDPAVADVAIVCVGLGHTHDFKGGDHEGSDKLRYPLGVTDVRLVNKTIKQNKKTVVVLVNGSPFGVEGFIDNAPAVLEAWYGGCELGTVVADIIFGDVNPSGRLPVSWPKRLKDIPAHKAFRTYPGTYHLLKEPKGLDKRRFRQIALYEEGIFIGYRHHDTNRVEPRFPFGHGLSYTTFAYDGLKIGAGSLSGDGTIEVSLTVTNSGTRAGAEVVQLYVQDVQASVPRPAKELKGFKRVALAPGQAERVAFTITRTDLAFYDEAKGAWVAEDGAFKVLVGGSSSDIRLQGTFEYKN
ncbi:MAG: glycoside hydrolase family 3 C-terminal domain-containing protein [Candidatus Lokiarchaeota archaeon]|nr:glycoside hydrolase family 3 C-terminal domain-containing protein [Candidatus Lokiarchaeota archaeon]